MGSIGIGPKPPSDSYQLAILTAQRLRIRPNSRVALGAENLIEKLFLGELRLPFMVSFDRVNPFLWR